MAEHQVATHEQWQTTRQFRVTRHDEYADSR
jgi:hypothetical protein